MPLFELFCGLTSSIIISPIMTIIDSSIIRSQINKTKFRESIVETSSDFLTGKISFKHPFSVMFLVYSSTYSTANVVELYCKKNQIDYKMPTLLSTSFVNIMTIAYKDKEYFKIFNTKPNVFPKRSFFLFTIRDMLTISSNFVFKNDFIKFLHNYIPNNTADFVASLTLPIMAQLISTPVHILAFDIYLRPNVELRSRLENIQKTYFSVCSGRVIRVVPAFCMGGFINDMLRNRL